MFSHYLTDIIAKLTLWDAVGFGGQLMFMMRFVVQWLASEKAQKSVMPISFWFFSLSGGLIVLVYALHIKNLVFILGQGLGLVIYLRNLYFILVEHRKSALPPSS